MKSPLPALLFALSLPAGAAAGPFDAEGSADLPFRLSGLIDLRYANTPSKALSWRRGGSGKSRFGGRDRNDSLPPDKGGSVFAVSQLSLVLEAPVQPWADLHVQVNADADPEAGNRSGGAMGIVEAYVKADRTGDFGPVGARVGGLIPPVSWEHPETAWSTHYTVTPSAIGSWVGEELRVFGAEAVWKPWNGPARLTAAVFGGGDQLGWLLVDRGWTMHDYQSRLDEALPLPNGQDEFPFRELDGRPGYYVRADATVANDLLKVGAGWFDNNAAGDEVGTQLPSTAPDARLGGGWLAFWRTSFWDAGAKLNWGPTNVIAQIARGRSDTFSLAATDWQAAYVLAAHHAGRWTPAVRFDTFLVERGATELDKGTAVTACLQYDANLRNRLSLEYLEIKADRNLAAAKAQTDRLFQLNWRLKWG